VYTLASSASSFTIDNMLKGVISVKGAADLTYANGHIVKRDAYLKTTKGDYILRSSMGSFNTIMSLGDATPAQANTIAINTALPKTIQVNFGTTATQGVLAFNFNIPVYAITNAVTNATGITVPGATEWLVMPGTNPLYLDGGEGACILLSNGVPTITGDATLGINVTYLAP